MELILESKALDAFRYFVSFGTLTMKRFAFCSLLLALSLHYGFGGRQEVTLETLPSNADDITCTGDLQCNSSDSFCADGDLETAKFPVLIPTDIRAKTVKRCDGKGCRLCVQVTMDISVAFISEFSEEFGSGDCSDYYDEDLDYYTEDDDLTDVSLYITVNKPSKDSLLCANLYILRVVPTSYLCSWVRVSLPQTSIPRRPDTNNRIKVGSVIYNSINARPGNELNITSYTDPRYMEELHVHHNLPGCRELDPKENILECEAPRINITGDSHNMSVGVDNGTSKRNTTLRVYHKSRHQRNDTRYNLYGDQRYIFPTSDIVPCLCFEAWYSDRVDAVRTLHCPFSSVSEKKIMRSSAFNVKIKDNTPLYNLSAPCNLSAEFSLCWKPNNHSECREIPNTRKEILSEQIGSVKLENLHPSLCLQVSIKGEVLHTHCLPITGTKQRKNEVLILRHNRENTSFCFMGENECVTLENATNQARRGAGFLEWKIVEDIMAGDCMKIFKPDKHREFYACNVEKYERSRWNWSRALSLLAIACFVLILLLKNENLKKWIKSVTTEKPLGEIFNNRRVLILYSPDNQEYENLVRVFASSLKGLQLDVVLDQWHRIQMSKIGPLVWYHEEKDTVFKKNGLIVLLFSEGAKEKYIAWKAQEATQRSDLDPYQSFGAVLNCVEPDFREKKNLEKYIVATFSPSRQNSVPEPFNSVLAYELPLCLDKFLKEIAGVNAKKLGQRQLKKESDKIREKLSGRDTMESVNSVGNVELQPLVQITSKVP
ncbi:interleukin-17 receptor C [Phyllobates terribilis]|uniref:interleukin-17 receptor C n=1 Tax=Phyllobates terribilis TaxID=111132 RepID=UPI003CCA926C